jgi:hypothetical protein
LAEIVIYPIYESKQTFAIGPYTFDATLDAMGCKREHRRARLPGAERVSRLLSRAPDRIMAETRNQGDLSSAQEGGCALLQDGPIIDDEVRSVSQPLRSR